MIQVVDRPFVTVHGVITPTVPEEGEVVREMAGGTKSPCIQRGFSLMEEMEETFEIGIENLTIYPVMAQGPAELSDPSWRFTWLGDRRVDQEHTREIPLDQCEAVRYSQAGAGGHKRVVSNEKKPSFVKLMKGLPLFG